MRKICVTSYMVGPYLKYDSVLNLLVRVMKTVYIVSSYSISKLAVK